MKKKIILTTVIALFISFTANSSTSISGEPGLLIIQDKIQKHKILNTFLNAVDNGELIVFEQKIEKSALIPLRIEIIYELNNSQPTIQVYSELKKRLVIPSHDGIRLRGITAVLNSAGHIIEIRAHVISN